MVNPRCDPSTYAGPVDERVVKNISERFYPLDADYLEFIRTCHGGIPLSCSVAVNEKSYRLARFLTLVDRKTELTEPFIPYRENPNVDERTMYSISYMLDGDHSTTRGLFSGLVPFAATSANDYLDRSYVDLFCFDYRLKSKPPSVVIWDSYKALDEVFAHEDLPSEEAFNEQGDYINVNYEAFLIPVASSFADFMDMLTNNE